MIVTGYFFVYLQVLLDTGIAYKDHWRPSAPFATLFIALIGVTARYSVVYAVIYSYYCYILLYISLYLYYIWYRFSCLSKSILPFKEMAKLVIDVVYTVIYSYSCYIYCYISLIYTLSYYRNFVYSPQSTQFHLLVTQLLLNEYKDFSACLVITG